MFKSFEKDIKFGKLFLYWIGFFILGVLLMELITPLSPSFIESDKKIVNEFCNLFNILLSLLAPLTETLIFMIFPYWLSIKDGKNFKWFVIVGISIWALLHLLSKNFPIFLYICCMGFFYYRCIEVKKWFAIIFFHYLINIPGILSCFLEIR